MHSREEAGESSCCCGLRNWACYRGRLVGVGAQRALLGPLSSPALTGEQSGFKMPQPPPQTADWDHITEVFSSVPDGELWMACLLFIVGCPF